jgi:hypothetical protein
MKQPDTIKIDDVEYIRKYLQKVPSGNIKIVILQRGWVKVGYFSKEGTECKLEKCATIRIFGTSNGLGEIAFNGPTSKTKLDKEPCTFHELTTIAKIDCVEEKWIKYL